MAFKHEQEDFRYIIRNGKDDFQDLIKRLSEFHHAPYRLIPIENFGAISPIKTTFIYKEAIEDEGASRLDDEGFQKSPQKCLRENYLPKEEIFRRIASFLDGVDPAPSRERSERL